MDPKQKHTERIPTVRSPRGFNPCALDPDEPLFWYTPTDPFTIRDSFEGVTILGAPGAGKSSASAQTHLRSMLRKGYGGLILTAKPNEREKIVRYCQEEGRLGSLLIVNPENEHCLNFLQYELSRPGRGAGITENLASLFSTVMEGEDGAGNADPYWPRASRQMLGHAIDLGRLAVGRISLEVLVKIVRTAPTSLAEVSSESWQQRSFCFRLISRASRRQLDRVDRGDLKQTAGYWLEEFPKLPDKLRSSIISMFTSVADGLLRGRLRTMFAGSTSFVPELTESGMIILADLPIKEFHEAGRIGQNILKLTFQRYWESRIQNKAIWPTFLYADECQHFINSQDASFAQTAREAKVAPVFITQNIPNLQIAFGGQDADAKVKSFIGSLATKVFHANSDTATNRYAEEIIGKDWKRRRSGGVSVDGERVQTNNGYSESFEPIVNANDFSALRQGGAKNGFLCDAIVFKSGRTWHATAKNYLKSTFRQSR
jgi:hypothetical protein